MNTPRHCGAYIDDTTAPEPLRAFLQVARSPGHGHSLGGAPPLFATTRRAFPARDDAGVAVKLDAGVRVRVTMASSFGDVGITPILENERGYWARAAVHELENFAAEP